MNINQPNIKQNSEEKNFQSYVFELELKPEDFDKKILDLGSGGGEFAKWAKEHGINSEIVNLEPFQKPKDKANLIKGVAEHLPFQNETFDLVISNCAIPNIFIGQDPAKIKGAIREATRVIRPGGEVKLAGVLKGNKYENQRKQREAIEQTLSQLKEVGFQVEEKRQAYTDTYEYDKIDKHKKTNILSEAYLITIKKPKNEQKDK